MADRSGVEIDYCPNCRGVWLDRGELDKIIERSVSPQVQTRYGGNDDRSRHQDPHYDYKKKRKDSFLGDLFDF